jgi:hypothetical protein
MLVHAGDRRNCALTRCCTIGIGIGQIGGAEAGIQRHVVGIVIGEVDRHGASSSSANLGSLVVTLEALSLVWTV